MGAAPGAVPGTRDLHPSTEGLLLVRPPQPSRQSPKLQEARENRVTSINARVPQVESIGSQGHSVWMSSANQAGNSPCHWEAMPSPETEKQQEGCVPTADPAGEGGVVRTQAYSSFYPFMGLGRVGAQPLPNTVREAPDLPSR